MLFMTAAIFFTACKKKEESSAPDMAKPEQEKKEEIYQIEIASSLLIGERTAPVTVINFSDFECPFSKRAFETMERLQKQYQGKLAYVYKHYPLATHREARHAAKASIAAEKQGKFPEMYRKLFENGQSITEENIALWAKEIELDPEQFAKDYADPETDRRLHEDITQGNTFGVRGTPTLFVNGRRLSGANTEQLERLVADELAKGEALKKNGVSDVYTEIIKNGLSRYVPPKRPLPVVPKDIYAVTVPSHSPTKGPTDAPITIILFTDLECPFCARFHADMTELQKEFRDQLRLVFVNLPLKFHNFAVPAAKAALAAGRQEKFWEMHDRLFAEQTAWKKENNFDQYLDGAAQALQLDVQKFKKDMDDPRTMEIIHRDLAFADAIGVRGTPGIFINGRYASGAFPLETFRTTIREELDRARPFMEKGLRGDALYQELIKDGKDAVFINQAAPEDPDKVFAIKLTGQEPSLGKKSAPITIVEFSDLQCPPCAKVSAAVDALREKHKDAIRVIYKQFPLGKQHPYAEPAARLLLAAKTIHGDDTHQLLRARLFATQTEWTTGGSADTFFERYAKELKLDWAKIRTAMTSAAVTESLAEDRAEASKNGVRAVPVLFVNGKKISGPQSTERLKIMIEELLGGKK